MAYVFLNDGGPESEEYGSNYFYFDESNVEAVAHIEKLLTSDIKRDAFFRTRLTNLCQASFHPINADTCKTKANNWFKYFSNLANHFGGSRVVNLK